MVRMRLAVIILFLFSLGAVPTSADDWPAFRRDAAHSAWDGAGEVAVAPKLLWEFDTGAVVESSPAVVDGVVYAGSFAQALFAVDGDSGEEIWQFPVGGLLRASPAVVAGTVYFGADDNKFYAVDAATGAANWTFDLGPGGQQSSPAVVDDVVYFGAFDKYVYALNAGTGTVRWKFRTGGGVLASPAVVDGVV
ncbi:MAG: PQQ-binding-like beta-propeller repeat protein [Proteobacteria bacterium]|nr:PQQ-binding-like beta-propeller repeat protein [Pseudomonadota bacterium]